MDSDKNIVMGAQEFLHLTLSFRHNPFLCLSFSLFISYISDLHHFLSVQEVCYLNQQTFVVLHGASVKFYLLRLSEVFSLRRLQVM